MKAESIVYAVAGMCFGILLGWVIATQQAGSAPAPPAAAPRAAHPALAAARARHGIDVVHMNWAGTAAFLRAVVDGADVQADVVALGLDPVDLVDLDEVNAAGRLHDDALRVAALAAEVVVLDNFSTGKRANLARWLT